MPKPDRSAWELSGRAGTSTGIYYHLNLGFSVKARAYPGPPYWCSRCNNNGCEHIDFVHENRWRLDQAQEASDAA